MNEHVKDFLAKYSEKLTREENYKELLEMREVCMIFIHHF